MKTPNPDFRQSGKPAHSQTSRIISRVFHASSTIRNSFQRKADCETAFAKKQQQRNFLFSSPLLKGFFSLSFSCFVFWVRNHQTFSTENENGFWGGKMIYFCLSVSTFPCVFPQIFTEKKAWNLRCTENQYMKYFREELETESALFHQTIETELNCEKWSHVEMF